MTALSGRVVDRMHICGRRRARAILHDVDAVHAGYTATQGPGVFHPLCGPYGESVIQSTYLLGHALYSGAAYMKASKGTILPHCAPLNTQLSILSAPPNRLPIASNGFLFQALLRPCYL